MTPKGTNARGFDRHFAPHRDEAARNNALIEWRTGVDLVDPGERVRFSTSDLGKYRITVTLFCPTRIAEALESAIVCELMGALHERARDSTEKSAQR